MERWGLISHEVFIQFFWTSQFPHKSVDFFIMSVITKDELVDFCGNGFFQSNFMIDWCEIRSEEGRELDGPAEPEAREVRFRTSGPGFRDESLSF